MRKRLINKLAIYFYFYSYFDLASQFNHKEITKREQEGILARSKHMEMQFDEFFFHCVFQNASRIQTVHCR